MKFILILSSLVLSISTAEVNRHKRDLIIPRIGPVKIRNFAYFASLMISGSESGKWYPACGATILSENWLVTAAHCVRQLGSKQPKIRTRSDDYFWVEGVKNAGVMHEIDTLIEHPDYSAREEIFYNDICLIKLKAPIKLKGEQWPIYLPNPKCPLRKTEMRILGFGSKIFTGKNESQVKNVLPSKLLSGKVTVLDEDTCKEIYSNNTITQEQFCATSKEYEAVNLDSGGPVVLYYTLVGIISVGNVASEKPGVYVNVRKYLDWIIEMTGIDNIAPWTLPTAASKKEPYSSMTNCTYG